MSGAVKNRITKARKPFNDHDPRPVALYSNKFSGFSFGGMYIP